MTTRDPTMLLALAERCEDAGVPSRKLDADIARTALGATVEEAYGNRIWLCGSGISSPSGCWEVPDWTASLDDCLELFDRALPDHNWYLVKTGYDNGIWQDGKARADVFSPLSSGGPPRWKGFGATPAMALLVATLRALAAEP